MICKRSDRTIFLMMLTRGGELGKPNLNFDATGEECWRFRGL